MAETFVSVWDAIVDDTSEVESIKIKSKIMMTIEQHIKEQGMTQQQAAEKMGVKQPRISDLVRGKMDRFTIDMLVNMLSTLGLTVEINFKKAA